MITFDNFSKYYFTRSGRKYIFKDVTLTIPSNRSIGVLGPNGAGKSTLLRLLGGSETASSGNVFIDGHVSWPLGLAVGFQGGLTGRENAEFVCRINGLKGELRSQIIQEIIDFVDIGKYFDMPVQTYSSGMRARLAFAFSISFVFDVYLIDELTSVGDQIFRNKANAAFSKIRESNSTLIYVSHNMASLRQNCKSALVLLNQQMTYYEDIEEGIREYMKYVDSKKDK